MYCNSPDLIKANSICTGSNPFPDGRREESLYTELFQPIVYLDECI